MFRKPVSKILALLLFAVLSLCVITTAYSALESQVIVDGASVSDNVPYLQTHWYGFSAAAGKGYCVTLSPSSGNSDLYLLDTNFNRVGYSRNTGIVKDKVWYGQSSAGALHIGCYGVYNPSSNFSVQIITSPYVRTITPTSGTAGTLVTITGFGFGDTRGTSYVSFGSVQAGSYSSWTNTQIKVYVPSGVASGTIQLVVYVASRPSNSTNFTASGGSSSSDGTMWRYDLGRTGNYANGPTTVPLNLKWSFVTGVENAFTVVADNVAYVGGAANKLYALDADTGTLKWTYTTSGGIYNAPAVANGIVYVTTNSSSLYALDAKTGSLKWQYEAAASFSSPAVFNGVVYFIGGNEINALDATTGILKWKYTVTTAGWISGSPVISNSRVYFGDNNGKIYALNASNGSVQWTYTMTNQFQNGTTPSLANSMLYIPATDRKSGGMIVVLDANTGSLKWTSYDSMKHFGNFAVADGVVYAPSHYLTALDASTGVGKWDIFYDWASTPSVSKGLLFYGRGTALYAADAVTGAEKWNYSLESNLADAPTIYNSKVYVGDANGKVYCFGQ